MNFKKTTNTQNTTFLLNMKRFSLYILRKQIEFLIDNYAKIKSNELNDKDIYLDNSKKIFNLIDKNIRLKRYSLINFIYFDL